MSSAMRRQVRQQLGQLGARLAVLLEREGRAEQPRRALDEREPLPLRNELRGNLLAVVLLQRRLVVEQIELRRRAGHEQIDDVLGLRREVRRARRERTVGSVCANSRSSSSADSATPADAEAGLLEEMAARDGAKNVRVHHCLRQRFIEVQERVGDERPRGLFRGVDAGNRISLDRRARPRRAPSGTVRAAACRTRRSARPRPASACASRRGGRRTWRGSSARCRRAGVSRNTRAASACAASKNASSFSVVSACSGVLVRTRRTVQCSRLVASNVMKLG